MEIKFEHGITEEQANIAALLVNLKNVTNDLNTVFYCVKLLLPYGFTYGRGASHIWIHEADEQGNPRNERWAIITE